MKNKIEIKEFVSGLKEGSGIGIAFIPFGITIGLIAKSFGMPMYLIFLSSFFIYAGTSQALLIKLLYVQHVSFLEATLSIALINLRYLIINIPVYNILKDYSKKVKATLGIMLTDEIVVFLKIKQKNNPSYIFGVNIIAYFSYCFSTIIGAIFSKYISGDIVNSLKFVLYAIFLSLLITAIIDNARYIKIVIITIMVKSIFMILSYTMRFSSGITTILVIILAPLIYAILSIIKEKIKNE